MRAQIDSPPAHGSISTAIKLSSLSVGRRAPRLLRLHKAVQSADRQRRPREPRRPDVLDRRRRPANLSHFALVRRARCRVQWQEDGAVYISRHGFRVAVCCRMSLKTVPLAIGDTAIELHNVPVLTQPLGGATRDDVFGVIGIDGLDQLKSYTFDYRTMRFSATAE